MAGGGEGAAAVSLLLTVTWVLNCARAAGKSDPSLCGQASCGSPPRSPDSPPLKKATPAAAAINTTMMADSVRAIGITLADIGSALRAHTDERETVGRNV